MTFTSTRFGQFTYFSTQLGDANWRGKNVLDFGGNVGNILRDPNSTIDPERYWCLDVDKESIEQGREAFPRSHWIFYDRFSFFFNPHGTPSLPLPEMDETFTYVVAYSVFTNTSQTDMLELVEDLKATLTPGGALAFTFIDPYYTTWGAERGRNNLQWRLDLETERRHITADEAKDVDQRAQGAKWFILVNGGDLYIETENVRRYACEDQRTFHVFHTTEYMKSLFPDATILPPVNNEMQHCCIIRN
jgi:SAM-dependent methyltransferase